MRQDFAVVMHSEGSLVFKKHGIVQKAECISKGGSCYDIMCVKLYQSLRYLL